MKSIVKSIGRPSKLTPQTIQILKATIGKGMSYADACTLSGISYSTFKKWQQKAEAGVKEYLFFLNELKKAKAMGKFQNIKKIREDSSWQSAAWLLERQDTEEVGRREKLSIDGELISKITKIFSNSYILTRFKLDIQVQQRPAN